MKKKRIFKPNKQNIIVEEGAVLIGTPTPYKILYTEVVENIETAKERIKELKIEYPEKSIHYFSV